MPLTMLPAMPLPISLTLSVTRFLGSALSLIVAINLSGCVSQEVSSTHGHKNHQASNNNNLHQNAANNLQNAQRWLANNRQQPGVIQTPSGLQYKVLSQSKHTSHCKPTSNAAVEVQYRMKLAETNYQVDSSYKRGRPATLPLQKVIRGWQEGVPLMNLGDHYEFYIPPHLAYGAAGGGRLIPANAALISDVQLLGASDCQ